MLLLDETASQPFFLLAPQWAVVPLVALATAAAIIASQALISASFSVTRQAIQLGLAPRLDIEHTSPSEMGRAIAAAYGIAVTLVPRELKLTSTRVQGPLADSVALLVSGAAPHVPTHEVLHTSCPLIPGSNPMQTIVNRLDELFRFNGFPQNAREVVRVQDACVCP